MTAITYSPEVLEIMNPEKKTAPLAKERQSQGNYTILEVVTPILLLGSALISFYLA